MLVKDPGSWVQQNKAYNYPENSMDSFPKTISILANDVIIMFLLKLCMTLEETATAADRASERQENERGRDGED